MRKKDALLILLWLLQWATTAGQTLTNYVNPFIGTANNGNTYPNAQAPFGMVSAGIQNQDYWDKPAYFPLSYVFGSSLFYGVSHTNVSGVGCPEKGSILLFPQQSMPDWKVFNTGELVDNEEATPGRYQCRLPKQNIAISLYATTRASLDVFDFSADSSAYLLLHGSRNLSRATGGNIYMAGSHAFSGKIVEGLFCNRSGMRFLYYYVQFEQQPKHVTFFEKGQAKPNGTQQAAGEDIGVTINFGQIKRVKAKIGVSYVSIENAKMNLQAEIPDWNEARVFAQTQSEWEKLLSVIAVKGGTLADKQKFYTALYHVLLHPNILQDVNGEYPKMGEQQGVGKLPPNQNRYTTFSLWDTYRTVHPLLALVYPHIQQQMLSSMIGMYTENGWLPKWEASSGESFTMVGDPAAIVIADSYLKGITNIDIATAFEAMLKHTDTSLSDNMMRPGYKSMLRYGYIPNDDKAGDYVWGSVSTALEYYFADWCIAQLAKAIGNPTVYTTFLSRSQQFLYYFDPNLKLVRPKQKDGSWYEPFHPLDESKELGWVNSGGIGFVEGNAWQYTWFVPHAMPTVVQKMGGPKSFVQQLQICFDSGYFQLINEPDMAYPWLFNYASGEAWRTSKEVTKCINKYFDTTASGLPGNDDCGTLSAWLIFAMMGFYPDCPGSTTYQTHLAAFDAVTIQLDTHYYSRPFIHITKENGNMFFNGKPVGPQINHRQLTQLQ